MTHATPEIEDLYRFKNVAFDVAQIYGVTTPQGIARAKRSLNRAAISLVSKGRKWSWLKVVGSFDTIVDEIEYSLSDVEKIHQMWIQDTNRRVLDEVTDEKFTKAVPDRTEASGTPSCYREEGVDSNGDKIISLYPVPSEVEEIFYRYTRRINPINNDEQDIRVAWGIPPSVLEPLTLLAAAMCCQGSNQRKYTELKLEAEAEIERAYAEDQHSPNKVYRAPIHGAAPRDDGPQLPPTYSDNGL